jgi:ATP-binding cassette subfamily B protein
MQHTVLPARSFTQSVRAIAPYFAPHRVPLAGIVTLAMSAAALAALEPLVIKKLFDAFVGASRRAGGPGDSWAGALSWLGALVAIALVCEPLSAARDWLVWRVRLAVNFSLMQASVERLHALPLSYHREQNVGATMTKIERGIAGSMSAFSAVIAQFVPSVIYLLVSAVVMFELDARLALAVVVFAPLPAILGARACREQVSREQGLMTRWTQIFARFNEVLGGIVVVKSFVMEEQEKRRFLDGVHEANALVLAGVATDARSSAICNLSSAIARIVALAVGGTLVMGGEITLGTLVAFTSYLGGVLNPVQSLTGMYQTLRRAGVSVDALLSILEARDALGDAPDAKEVQRFHGNVDFECVGFQYCADKPVLRGINLSVRAGEVIALVGPSGTGKSTLMALLQRLYDPTAGVIRIDGQEIAGLKQRSLRFNIGIVLQEGTLFSDNIRDNIAFGRPGASFEEIVAAARAANAHEFITALPQGYDTLVGERGCKLSGGERQRVAIARALLKDAPILVLDEATSALDAESEEKVQEALARLTRGRTTFVIAHRLATITGADRIVVLKEGEVAEIGSHEDLIRSNGYYASLVRRQTRGLLLDAA